MKLSMAGYVAKGNAHKLTPDECYSNEEAVVSTTSRCLEPQQALQRRMVMNPKAKYDNVSLNDKLLVGPDLLNNLCGVQL